MVKSNLGSTKEKKCIIKIKLDLYLVIGKVKMNLGSSKFASYYDHD